LAAAVLLLGFGESSATTTPAVSPAAGASSSVQPATLSVTVWEDKNANGKKDPDDTARVDGATVTVVELKPAPGNPSINVYLPVIVDGRPARTNRSTNGVYTIGNLRPGTYSVKFAAGDYRFTNPSSGVAPITLTAGRTTQVSAGAHHTVSISGMAWVDNNANGVKDSDDSELAGVTVSVVDSNGAAVSRLGETTPATDTTNDDEITTWYDETGEYSIRYLRPGTYSVKFELPEGYLFTRKLATGGHSDVDPSAADSTNRIAKTAEKRFSATAAPTTGWDVGAIRTTDAASISGEVWVDSDGDGVRDKGEPGLKGAAVKALRDGSPAGSAETDTNGAYALSGLLPGPFELVVTAPVGYGFTGRGAGSDDLVDSDVDPASGRSGVFTLALRGAKKVDAGVYRLGPEGPVTPAPLLSLVKSASGKAPVGEGDVISYSFWVRNAGNATLSEISVSDPKAGKVTCPGTVLAPEGSMTCTASYEASAADASAGKVASTATVTALADGAKVSATDSVSFDLKSAKATVGRLAGADRYATAAAISKETFKPGVPVVYVATGVNYPDALAGSAASDGPILLVTKDSIPGATLAELKRLKPKRIIVLGGAGVVSAEVETALAPLTAGRVSRLAGADRYSTAAKISASHYRPGAAVAFVATGADFPDALAGGPAAAKLGGPILLTQKDKLPAATVSELKRLKPKRIVVLGGTGVVSAEVEIALEAHTGGKVSRLAGPDRYRTAAAISKDGFNPGVPVVYVATGLNFPDALAGGATAALKDGPVLLVSGTSIPKATDDELTRLKPKRIVVLGGTAVMPESVRDDLNTYIR